MKKKMRNLLDALLARLGEQSTWQGIGFLVALTGSKFGLGMDWGPAAALGSTISALVKTLLPDPVVAPPDEVSK